MNWKRTARWSWLILPFLLLALWPGVALAFNGTLYEVTESMKAKGGEVTRRLAIASLMGKVNGGSPVCPVGLVGADGKCDIVAIASDNIKINTGVFPPKAVGPVEGTFAIVVNEPGTVDAPEAVVIRGTLKGKINLSPAVLFAGSGGALGVPLGTIEGRWKAHGVKGTALEGFSDHGTFTGVFRLPIAANPTCLGDEDPADCVFFYYFGEPTDPSANPALFGSSGGLGVPIGGNERSLNAATVRLDIEFQ